MTILHSPEEPTTSVSAAEVIRNFGYWQQQALSGPLTITHHGRARIMLISTDMYERLNRRQGKPATESGEVSILIDSMAEGFVQFDRDLRIVTLNIVAEAFFGLRLDEVRGLSHTDRIFSSSSDEVRQALARVQKTREMESCHIDSLMRPGRRLLLRIFPYGDGVALLFINTTEQDRLRRDAENMRALRAALGKLKRIAVLRLDIRGIMLNADDALTELTGFTFEDLQHTRLLDCVVPADRGLAGTVYSQLAVSGQAGIATVRVIVKSGEERLLNMAFVPVIRDAVQIGTILMVTDAD